MQIINDALEVTLTTELQVLFFVVVSILILIGKANKAKGMLDKKMKGMWNFCLREAGGGGALESYAVHFRNVYLDLDACANVLCIIAVFNSNLKAVTAAISSQNSTWCIHDAVQ